MFINKIGADHLEKGVNCQDYGYDGQNIKIVCDGCSEGKHSEVGAKLYCHISGEKFQDTISIFQNLIKIIGSRPQTLKDYMSFTILELINYYDSDFMLNYCGDGFVILQDYDGNITFEEISDGEYPKYYIYNFIGSEYLKYYKDGVDFTQKVYPKEKYAKVGIASDGLRYILKADEKLQEEFKECLKSGKEIKTKLFINRNHNIFRDDVTIVF